MKYIKLFETMAQYESYMDGEPIFPNVSYTEDNSEVHFMKSKPLSKLFIFDQYYQSELDYLRNALEKERVRIGVPNLSLNVETGILEEYVGNFECIDSELLSYLRSIKAQSFSGDILDINMVGYYPNQTLYFRTTDGQAGMGFYIWEGTPAEDYGKYGYAID
jgi:hypothetical protein